MGAPLMEAPGAMAVATGREDQGRGTRGNCAAAQHVEQLADAADRKRQATCKARTAMLGGTLIESHDDRGRPTWILSRWSFTREFTSLTDVEALLVRMGSRP